MEGEAMQQLDGDADACVAVAEASRSRRWQGGSCDRLSAEKAGVLRRLEPRDMGPRHAGGAHAVFRAERGEMTL